MHAPILRIYFDNFFIIIGVLLGIIFSPIMSWFWCMMYRECKYVDTRHSRKARSTRPIPLLIISQSCLVLFLSFYMHASQWFLASSSYILLYACFFHQSFHFIYNIVIRSRLDSNSKFLIDLNSILTYYTHENPK